MSEEAEQRRPWPILAATCLMIVSVVVVVFSVFDTHDNQDTLRLLLTRETYAEKLASSVLFWFSNTMPLYSRLSFEFVLPALFLIIPFSILVFLQMSWSRWLYVALVVLILPPLMYWSSIILEEFTWATALMCIGLLGIIGSVVLLFLGSSNRWFMAVQND